MIFRLFGTKNHAKIFVIILDNMSKYQNIAYRGIHGNQKSSGFYKNLPFNTFIFFENP